MAAPRHAMPAMAGAVVEREGAGQRAIGMARAATEHRVAVVQTMVAAVEEVAARGVREAVIMAAAVGATTRTTVAHQRECEVAVRVAP